MSRTSLPPANHEDPPQPASADRLEQRAAEIAREQGQQSVKDHHRKQAYSEMQQTGLPPSDDEGNPVETD